MNCYSKSNDPSVKSNNTTHSGNSGSYSHRLIIAAACLFIIIGYILMSGSANTQQAFNPDIFSTTRIVIAPMLCMAGYLLIIVGILWKK
jgi:hypothetical protein